MILFKYTIVYAIMVLGGCLGQHGSPVDSLSVCHLHGQGSNPRGGKIKEAVFGVPHLFVIARLVKQQLAHSYSLTLVIKSLNSMLHCINFKVHFLKLTGSIIYIYIYTLHS